MTDQRQSSCAENGAIKFARRRVVAFVRPACLLFNPAMEM
jgi:hypothetical protein